MNYEQKTTLFGFVKSLELGPHQSGHCYQLFLQDQPFMLLTDSLHSQLNQKGIILLSLVVLQPLDVSVNKPFEGMICVILFNYLIDKGKKV